MNLAQGSGVNEIPCQPEGGIVAQIQHAADLQAFCLTERLDLFKLLKAGAQRLVRKDVLAGLKRLKNALTANAVVIANGHNFHFGIGKECGIIGITGLGKDTTGVFKGLRILLPEACDFHTGRHAGHFSQHSDVNMPDSGKCDFHGAPHFNSAAALSGSQKSSAWAWRRMMVAGTSTEISAFTVFSTAQALLAAGTVQKR